MKPSKSNNDPSKEGGKLRNFDLSVEEIKIIKAIRELSDSLENLERNNPNPVRLEFFRNEIKNLEDKLEEVRENTLLR